jgi:PEGA domain-containing protein
MGVAMKKALRRVDPFLWGLLLVSALLLPAPMHAANDVMGEIQFEGKTHIEKTSGVWVDGGYVGYLKELKGSRKVLLLPGEHVITVRQDGYQDFTQKILVQPGETEVIRIVMEKAPIGVLPDVTATVKIAVNPSRARCSWTVFLWDTRGSLGAWVERSSNASCSGNISDQGCPSRLPHF